MQRKIYQVISLFSGCGGLDLGFKGGFEFLQQYHKPHSFETIWANDMDANACKTFAANFKIPIVLGDITAILQGNYPELATKMPLAADVVLGGFPCQDFSLAGKRKGLQADRGKLYQSMVLAVKNTRPAVFVAENVKGLLKLGSGQSDYQNNRRFRCIGLRCFL